MQDWHKYAVEKGIHPSVIGYVSAFAHQAAVVGPRTWGRVSDILKQEGLADDVLRLLVEQQLGSALGDAFIEAHRAASSLPDAEQVLAGNVTSIDQLDPSTAYALASALAYQLQDEAAASAKARGVNASSVGDTTPEWQQRAGNALTFAMNNFQPEITILYAKFAIAILRLPYASSRTPGFQEFSVRYKDLVTA